MKLRKIQIKNFRSLKDLEVDLEEHFSIIVGKNNSGKTSMLLALERFLGGVGNSRFELDDFNIECQKELEDILDEKLDGGETPSMCGISLRLFIEYDQHDDLSNVGNKVIMDLDPDNRWIILEFLYHLPQENLFAMKRDFLSHKSKKGAKAKSARDYIRDCHKKYFKVDRRSVLYDHDNSIVNESNYVDLIKENIRIDDIVSFKRINARRSVSNKDTDRSLSAMSAKIYAAMSSDDSDEEMLEAFKEAVGEADIQLDDIYADLFKDVIADVRRFGGIKEGDTEIKIKSTLKHRDMLEENTTVMYGRETDVHVLPESYNGLGYLNLINMIFEVKIILNEFKRGKSPKPADINLLFIEEPEAHTHPQMQAIFVKNIKNLVGKEITNANGTSRSIQTIISTHSAHIVSESEFDDIKYFKKENHHTKSRSLKELEMLYKDSGNHGHYKFLKQYLTLNRSQLFFADKAILVEGDTERILLPAMMCKMDQVDAAEAWTSGSKLPLPLLSQNISIIEVGAHSHIFEIFLDFIGIKTLVITDIDSAVEEDQTDKQGKKLLNKDGSVRKAIRGHAIEGSTHTTNYALQFFHSVNSDITYFIGLGIDQKKVRKNAASSKWEAHADGYVMCIFQVSEENSSGERYHARSFEDAFFHVNRNFVKDSTEAEEGVQKFGFPSLVEKHLRTYIDDLGSSFDMAEKGITKKPSFAIEILLNSKTISEERKNQKGERDSFVFEYSNWNTPAYIREGLAWIKTE